MANSAEAMEESLGTLYGQVWQKHNETDLPEEIFHYTSAEGVCGILSKKTFFASDIFCLNDPTEGQYGRSVILDVLRTKRGAVAESLLEGFEQEPLFPGVGKHWAMYSVSFCGTRDLLGQWRGYGGTAGYAVGLRLATLLKDAGKRFAMLRLLYDSGLQHDLINNFVSEAVDIFDRHRSSGNEGLLLNQIARYAIQCMFNLKHPAFRGEDEWRIFMVEPYDNRGFPVHYRTSGARIVPYLELCLDPECFSTVILGPTVATYPNEHAVTSLLITGGFKGAKCEVSSIPFRV